VSGTPVDSVFQERPPTMAYLWCNSQVDLFSLCLCLFKEVFSLGKQEKLRAHYSCTAGNLRKLRRQVGDYATLPILHGWNLTSVLRGFFFFPSLNTNSLFQDLTSLRGGPKTASGKESLSSSHKRCSGQGTPRYHPKAADATF
jgi:hypothetical protein